jgi:hypothetical protein
MVELAVLAVKQVRAAPVATELQEHLVSLVALAEPVEIPAYLVSVEMAEHLAPAEPAVQPERLARMVLQVWPAMVVTAATAVLER